VCRNIDLSHFTIYVMNEMSANFGPMDRLMVKLYKTKVHEALYYLEILMCSEPKWLCTFRDWVKFLNRISQVMYLLDLLIKVFTDAQVQEECQF